MTSSAPSEILPVLASIEVSLGLTANTGVGRLVVGFVR
jgi:hypothetical protein